MDEIIIGQTIFWEAVRWFTIISLLIYIGFSLIVIRQVTLMTDTLEVGFEEPVRILALFHFIFAVATFIVAILTLL